MNHSLEHGEIGVIIRPFIRGVYIVTICGSVVFLYLSMFI